MSATGRYETARMWFGWIKFRECGELLYENRFGLRLKWTYCKGYVRLAVLCRPEVWCRRENKIGRLSKVDRSIARVMCGVQLEEKH